jgi:uncharacterized alpha-E superfamily protein
MLSRHAEDLFWLGRHLERAADTARMLDVTYHALLESPPSEAEKVWTDLLDVLHLRKAFFDNHDRADASTVPAFLVVHMDNAGAIVPSVRRARENARSVRELLSTELWEAVNSFWLELGSRDLRRDLELQPYGLLRLVRRRCQEVSGAAMETMPHDDSWRFMSLGAMLERAEIGVRLLRVKIEPAAAGRDDLSFQQAVEVLKSASGLEAFRRAHPGALTIENVLAFLLLAPTFPRSILYSLTAAEAQLAQLLPTERLSRPQRVIGRLRSDLEFADINELMAGEASEFLGRVLNDIRWAAELIGVQFFRNTEDLNVLHAVEATT